MSKNTLAVALAENKRLREQVEYLEAKLQVVEQWHGQFQDDIMTIVLADSAAMGKDTFGPVRIRRINQRRDELWHQYCKALQAHPEADYLREDIDRRLRQIMKDDAAPWRARYFGWSENEQS